MKEQLISYGAITSDFKVLAKYKKRLKKIKDGEIKPHRLDCYELGENIHYHTMVKFENIGLDLPDNYEIFYPSDKYPPHVDENGLSYFIGLESGEFYIDGVTYNITPFVLYAFDARKPHNSNFPSIMLG